MPSTVCTSLPVCTCPLSSPVHTWMEQSRCAVRFNTLKRGGSPLRREISLPQEKPPGTSRNSPECQRNPLQRVLRSNVSENPATPPEMMRDHVACLLPPIHNVEKSRDQAAQSRLSPRCVIKVVDLSIVHLIVPTSTDYQNRQNRSTS